jgi:hypothetical protein
MGSFISNGVNMHSIMRDQHSPGFAANLDSRECADVQTKYIDQEQA